ncbi:Cyclin, N-terminal domain containing protein [Histomonas meleagridis]|uniref:Cyclin, N-terminal domain containing protein n=1 Tax=Histomonas meleagridis TaxID=135588 RepID=UPI0035597AD8|nr:Cyclin, N-terminal domain containing protein [Histomonas meleagridis]KAH0797463.1 Cyclin, N-terminal domain containing protein [Histomonas meleagridis]
MSKISVARRTNGLTDAKLSRRTPLGQLANHTVARQPVQKVSQITRVIPREPFKHTEIPIGSIEDPQDVVEFEHIIYRTMRQNEISAIPLTFNQKEITMKDRNLLVDAMCRFHFKLCLTTNGFYRFLGILDRFITTAHIPRRKLILYGCACLFIASKIEDVQPAQSDDLIELSRHEFTRNELFEAENYVINSIVFDTTFPTPLFFLTQFMRISGQTKKSILLARYILEICQSSEHFFGSKASLMASVAVMACRLLCGEEKWTTELRQYTMYTEEDLMPHIKVVKEMLSQKDREETRFMRRKYGSDLFLNVADVDVSKLN